LVNVLVAKTTNEGFGSFAVKVVPGLAILPHFRAIFVSSAIASSLSVDPVVRLTSRPVLVVDRGVVGPRKAGGCYIAADARMSIICAPGLRVPVMKSNPCCS
jgi:hypothetical protein